MLLKNINLQRVEIIQKNEGIVIKGGNTDANIIEDLTLEFIIEDMTID